MMTVSKDEFNRFEVDLKELLDLKFDYVTEQVNELNKKMDGVIKFEQNSSKELAQINRKAEKAHSRIDDMVIAFKDDHVLLHGEKDQPGMVDDVRILKQSREGVLKYVRRAAYAAITVLVAGLVTYILATAFGITF